MNPTPDTPIRGDEPPVDLGDYDGQAEAEIRPASSPPAEYAEHALTVHHPVAFGRVLRYRALRRMTGRDVLAVTRTLHMHRYQWASPTQSYGWRARDSVRLFQRVRRLPVDGVYGEATHQKLAWLFDGYSDWLYTHADVTPTRPERTARDRLMHALWYCYSLRPWYYHPVRPFILYGYEDRVGYAFDCSWLVKQVFYLAKLPSPDGYSYSSGYGNTESLRAAGRQVATAMPGDVIHYGYYGSPSNPAHVAVASGNDHCIGFGASGGPFLLPVNYRPVREIRRHISE